ncbi:hypothetical protein GB937_010800 [Aspergillus fischeri]|nr:hypothetical protein GB937_010800 [Aspergillus fischeri]
MRALKRQKKPNFSKTAQEFNVPMQRLRRCWNGIPSHSDRALTNTKLTAAQEMALRQYINKLIKLDIPPRPQQIGNANIKLEGKELLRLNGSKHTSPGSLNHGSIISEDRIGKDQWIVTREFKKTPFSPSNTNQEYTTIVEAISADGYFIPPFIIFGGKCILAGWFKVCGEPDYIISISESGYINDLLAYQWIQHFKRHTRRRMVGLKRLLLCNGYGSHMTYKVIEFCEKHNIILYFLPPHTSHLLQLLDVSIFHAYKH